MALSRLLCSLSLEDWAELVTQKKPQKLRMVAKAQAVSEAVTALVVTAVTITMAVENDQRTAEEFQRVAKAERMGIGSRETQRNDGHRNSKRKGRKARPRYQRREAVGSGNSRPRTITLVGDACCYLLLSAAGVEGHGFQKLPRAAAQWWLNPREISLQPAHPDPRAIDPQAPRVRNCKPLYLWGQFLGLGCQRRITSTGGPHPAHFHL